MTDAIAESIRIQARLRDCQTAQEINDVSDQERPKFAKLDRTQQIIISNLKKYMLQHEVSE